jgi:hypothetical protein
VTPGLANTSDSGTAQPGARRVRRTNLLASDASTGRAKTQALAVVPSPLSKTQPYSCEMSTCPGMTAKSSPLP